MDSFPTRWQADGNRARGLKKATSQARGRGKSSRPVLPRKVHYHLPPGFLSQNSRLPLLALSSPMTSLLRPPFPITGVLIWALLGFYPEEEAHDERGLCRWGGGGGWLGGRVRRWREIKARASADKINKPRGADVQDRGCSQ